MMATWLADVLRGAGLIVEEIAGWQDRGHGQLADDGMVVVDHHTAGGPNGRAPSLATCIYGVPAVSGPLCNVMQTREMWEEDHFIIIAAGNSYNAGSGGWNGSSGNWHTIGLEVEHTGVEWYPDPARAHQTRRFNAAVLKHLGYGDAAMLCQHFEWSSAGKIDIAQGVDPNLWRQQTTDLMRGEGEDMTPDQARKLDALYETAVFGGIGAKDSISMNVEWVRSYLGGVPGVFPDLVARINSGQPVPAPADVDEQAVADAIISTMGEDLAKKILDKMAARLDQ